MSLDESLIQGPYLMGFGGPDQLFLNHLHMPVGSVKDVSEPNVSFKGPIPCQNNIVIISGTMER